jgi:hypothetical protein
MSAGLSLSEAVSSALGYSLGGVFTSSPQKLWNQFSQWRVFRALQHSIDGTLTTTLSPSVTVPTATSPSTTYKYQKNWD